MQLPKRPAPYILALLIAILAVLTLWLQRAVTAPELLQALRRRNAVKSSPPAPRPAPLSQH